MKMFSINVTTVYITEAVALEFELWVAADLRCILSLYNKISRQLRDEMHR